MSYVLVKWLQMSLAYIGAGNGSPVCTVALLWSCTVRVVHFIYINSKTVTWMSLKSLGICWTLPVYFSYMLETMIKVVHKEEPQQTGQDPFLKEAEVEHPLFEQLHKKGKRGIKERKMVGFDVNFIGLKVTTEKTWWVCLWGEFLG